MPHSQTLEALRHWVGSEEGLRLYQKLIDDLWLQQTPEEFTLTLAALLSRERLLVNSKNNTVNPIGCSLVYLDAILNGEDVRNKRAIFERVIMSLLRMLHSVEEDNHDLIQLLTNVLGEGAPILESLEGVNDRYCAKKYDGLDHSRAFKDAWEGLVKSMEAIEIADTEWILVKRYDLYPFIIWARIY